MKYSVHFSGYASTWVDVEADSLDEALDKAEPYWSLCHQCASAGGFSEDWEPSYVYEEPSGDLVWRAEG